MRETQAKIDSQHVSRVLGWCVAAIDVLAAAFLALFYALNRGSAVSLLGTLAFSLLPLSGAVIIARQPRNPVGWLAAVLGLIFVFSDLLAQYGTYALILHPGVLPFGGIAAWFAAWSWMTVYALVIPFLLLIPNGRLLSSRWLALIWTGLATNLPLVVFMLVVLIPVNKVPLLKSQNLTTAQIGPAALLLWRTMQVWQPLQFLLIIVATIGLYIRFAHSQGVERLQLKWIFLAITTIPIAVALGFLSGNGSNSLINTTYMVVNFLSACAFPTALAIAVTRYHLYDIDVIIRRTLLYFSLTFSLAVVYLGSVILLQALFTLLTGQHSTASLVISTLIIVALFTPLRQSIQALIDRRFFRAKYDTYQMLESFASRQRENVDLEQYSAQLLAVIDDALHPDRVSLYLVKTQDARQKSG